MADPSRLYPDQHLAVSDPRNVNIGQSKRMSWLYQPNRFHSFWKILLLIRKWSDTIKQLRYPMPAKSLDAGEQTREAPLQPRVHPSDFQSENPSHESKRKHQ
jgi:hypothetical protein